MQINNKNLNKNFKLILINLFIINLFIINYSCAKDLSHLSELFKNPAADIEKKFGIGADYIYMFAGIKDNWRCFLRHNQPGANLHLDYHWNYVMFELGYNWTTRKSKHFKLQTGDILFGQTNDNDTLLTGQIRYRGTHLGLNFFANLYYTLDLVTYIGCNFARPHITIQSSNSDSNIGVKLVQTLGKTSFVPRLGIGMRAAWNDKFSWRAMCYYDKNSSIHLRYAAGFNVRPFKDALTFSLGILSRI